MKTKHFTTGLSLLALLVACDQEKEQELTVPNKEPIILEEFEVLPDLSETSSVYEILDVDGNGSLGIQEISIESAVQEVPILVFNEEEVADFFETYTISDEDQEEDVSDGSQQDKLPVESMYTVQLESTACATVSCRTLIREEAERLQKVATHNCLSIMATVVCCEQGQAKSVGLYITPGVICQEVSRQSLSPQENRETH